MIGFENVRKEYPGGTLAVEDFSLEIASHEALVLVGTSGSGKTTLMRMINRMVDPTSGRVHIDGDEMASLDQVQVRRSVLGYVMQASGLLPHRTVLDNISTVARAARHLEERRPVGAPTSSWAPVGLDAALARRYPGQLSGGQQQRVGVARGLAADPNILLMDEPFGAVDPIVRRELQQELMHLQRDLKKTIVFVTHDIDEAFLVGDRVVLLKPGGVIAQIGTPQEILAEPGRRLRGELRGRGPRGPHSARRTGRRARRRGRCRRARRRRAGGSRRRRTWVGG